MNSLVNPVLQQKFEKVESQKQAVLSDVSGLSADQLRFRPQPTAWSALEVLDHLAKTEKAIFSAVRTQLPKGNPVTLKDRMGALMVIAVMQSPIRIKVPPAATMVIPEATTDLSEICGYWTNTRDDLAGLLASLQPEQLNCGLFRHPVSGWMNITQTLSFISAHLRHHCYQLNRLKVAARRA